MGFECTIGELTAFEQNKKKTFFPQNYFDGSSIINKTKAKYTIH